MRSRRFKIVLRAVLVVVSIGLVLLVAVGYWRFNNSMRDLYTPGWAVDLVIEHMETHNGDWPKNWDELHETFAKNPSRRGTDWDEFPRRVGIDFTADPAKLANASEVNGEPFRVIWSLAYPDARLPTRPNLTLFGYLRERTSRAAVNSDESNRAAAREQRR